MIEEKIFNCEIHNYLMRAYNKRDLTDKLNIILDAHKNKKFKKINSLISSSALSLFRMKLKDIFDKIKCEKNFDMEFVYDAHFNNKIFTKEREIWRYLVGAENINYEYDHINGLNELIEHHLYFFQINVNFIGEGDFSYMPGREEYNKAIIELGNCKEYNIILYRQERPVTLLQ